MARGKTGTKGKKITHTLRDNWIEDWEKINHKSSTYVSFIKTQDIKSKGSKSRTPDFENKGQDLNLLSTNERLFYYQLLFDNKIIWVKEQYPLLPLERAMALAKSLNIRYPTYPFTANVEVVMTSDFYCGNVFGTESVYSIKDVKAFASNVSDKIKENLENKEKIQKAFWETKGIKFHLILSSEIKNTFTINLGQLAPFINLNLIQDILLPRWLICFEDSLTTATNLRVSDLLIQISTNINIHYSDSVALFQHCLWNKVIKANLNIPLYYEKKVSEFNLRMA
jgi:hypothetical protein